MKPGPMEASRDCCPLCQGLNWSIEIADFNILGSWRSNLRRCKTCGTAWFAESNLWAAEAYKDSIASLDTGCVRRSESFIGLIAPYLIIKGKTKSVLDWGAGSGLTVRKLRDLGLDAWAYEPFGECPLAKGFWYSSETETFGHDFCTILAQEVIEHIQDIRGFFEMTLNRSEDLLFTTEIVSRRVSRDWWYLLPETGQHISFLSMGGINHICNKLSLHYCKSRDGSAHLLTRRRRNIFAFRVMTNKIVRLFFMGAWRSYIYLLGKLGTAFQERDYYDIRKRTSEE